MSQRQSPDRPPAWLELAAEVRAQLAVMGPIVALESTVIAHGLPWPHNLETALAMEAAVREGGAVPATIGICSGAATVGMTRVQIEQFAQKDGVSKASARDIPMLLAEGSSGATTVAGTLACAAAAGIPVMATGGIGGVHRNHEVTGDISADLGALAKYPVSVVASGAKCILDLPMTLEHLETHGVAVVGYGCSHFPAFYYADSGLALERSVASVAGAARLVAMTWLAGLGGLLLANPIPAAAAMDRDTVEQLVAEAVSAAQRQNISGKALTPFLLSRLAQDSEGDSLAANKALLIANASLAGRIAAAACAGAG